MNTLTILQQNVIDKVDVLLREKFAADIQGLISQYQMDETKTWKLLSDLVDDVRAQGYSDGVDRGFQSGLDACRDD